MKITFQIFRYNKSLIYMVTMICLDPFADMDRMFHIHKKCIMEKYIRLTVPAMNLKVMQNFFD
jgi:hypothetical protein